MRVETRGTQKDYGYIISEFNYEVEYASISSGGTPVPVIFREDEPSNFDLHYINTEINEPILEYVYLIVDMYLVEYIAVNYQWYRGWLNNDNWGKVYYGQHKVYDASNSSTFKLCLSIIDDEMTLSDEQIQQIISESTEVE